MPEDDTQHPAHYPADKQGEDAKSVNEELQLKRTHDHYKRDKRIKDLKNYLAYALLVFVSTMFVLTILVWSAQYLIPEEYKIYRLEKEQLERLQVFLLSGSVTGLLTISGKKLLEDM